MLKQRNSVNILLLFSIFLTGCIYADLDTSFAMRLYDLGLYDDARFEFERIDSKDYDNIDYYIANCYNNSGDFIESINKYDLIIDNTNDYIVLKVSALECARVAILSGKPNLAVECLERAIARGAEIDTSMLLYIKVIAENRWEDLGFEPPSKKSPSLAQFMAILLPGSGQYYAGDLTNGLKSLGVNSAIWTLIIASVDRGYYTRAFAIFFLFAPNYWLGASNKAAEIAQETNKNDYLRACRQAVEELKWRENQ